MVVVVHIAGEGRWWYGQQVREQYIELGGGMYSRLGIVYRTDGGVLVYTAGKG